MSSIYHQKYGLIAIYLNTSGLDFMVGIMQIRSSELPPVAPTRARAAFQSSFSERVSGKRRRAFRLQPVGLFLFYLIEYSPVCAVAVTSRER